MHGVDAGQKLTDAAMRTLEERINAAYQEAYNNLGSTIWEYFEKFERRDEEERTRMDDGEITPEEYRQWRLNQIGRGKRYEALRNRLAERITNVNEAANSYVNDATPGIYSLNRNYAAYTIESVAGDVSFDLWDEQTVKRLVVEQPELMPYYPAERALKRGIDLEFGKKQITASVTSSILQGKSIKNMADDLQNRIVTMGRNSAIRTARTAVTGAQNAGRLDSYHAAEKMGIKCRKEWMATLDNRTRHSHAMLDGEVVDNDKKFSNGCRFPGDPNGPPAEIYNCRCTLVSAIDGIDTSSGKRRVRNPGTGQNEIIENMTYAEWAGWKASLKNSQNAEDDAKTLKFFGADARDNLKSIVKRSTIKLTNGFSCFPDNDKLNKNVQCVKPSKTYFDVAMHGSPTAVGFGTSETNMSPRLLASVIRHSEGWNGQKIRLLSCSTGKQNGDDYCFAEELANALGVEVKAPNDTLYIYERGKMQVGKFGNGQFVSFKPNQRRRKK